MGKVFCVCPFVSSLKGRMILHGWWSNLENSGFSIPLANSNKVKNYYLARRWHLPRSFSRLRSLVFYHVHAPYFPVICPKVYLLVYADNLLFYAIGDEAERTFMCLQDTSDRVMLCFHHWKLEVSLENVTPQTFRAVAPQTTKMRDKSHAITCTTRLKFLGVIFNRNLTFKGHFIHLKDEAYKLYLVLYLSNRNWQSLYV